jgi:hypothetical protein
VSIVALIEVLTKSELVPGKVTFMLLGTLREIDVTGTGVQADGSGFGLELTCQFNSIPAPPVFS